MNDHVRYRRIHDYYAFDEVDLSILQGAFSEG